MLNCLYIELYKIFHKKTIYICLAIILILSALFTYFSFLMGTTVQSFPTELLESMSSMLLPLLAIIIQVDIFCSEFSKGTIKNSLTRPVTRIQLFTAKIISLFIMISCFYIFIFIISYSIIGFNAVMGNSTIGNLDQLSIGLLVQTLKNYIISIFPMFAFFTIFQTKQNILIQ